MKTFLNKEDYEIYQVNIPVRLLFGKRKKAFLLNMLEKLHPCFSERNVYDNKLYLSGKGFISELTVMEKNKLDEYRLKYPGTKLITENKKLVFGKTISKYCWSFALIAGIVFLCLFIKGRVTKTTPTPVEEIIKEQNVVQVFNKQQSIFQKILDEVFSVKGEIRKLQWKCDGFLEKIDVTVEGVWPTDLINLWNEKNTDPMPLFSSVVNSGKKPCFTISQETEILCNPKLDKIKDRRGFYEELRKIIENENGTIQLETYRPMKIEFEVPLERDLKKFLERVSECSKNYGVNPSGLNYENRKVSLLLGIEFTDSYEDCFEKNILEYLASKELSINEKLPVEKNNTGKQESQKTMPVEEKKIPEKTLKAEKTVGRINHSGNKTKVFVKNEKGKVEERIVDLQ